MRVKTDFKIFVLDGNMFTLNIYQQHLINLGFTDISLYHNATECINELPNQPDIIFLDHSINFSTGVDVLKKIKRFNPDIYVIFIAGLEDVETVIESLKYGAFDFIVRGENDVKTLDNVIDKIRRVKELLKINNTEHFKKFGSIFPVNS